ncbi:hypothetical protein AB0P21_34890 [Kribbella sp. NPDC056861]|uniref:hypothetical protein n=1 Tax=Kribbella sp. NPDC056861 TaxID=3154857 RepID=UPI003438EDF9
MAVAKATVLLAATAALAGCSLLKPTAAPPPSGGKPDACHLLTDKQVHLALGGAPKSTEDLSSAAMPVSCRYVGQGDAYLTISAHRVTDVVDAQSELAGARKSCPTATALDTSEMNVDTATGLICPATPTGGGAITWAEWQTIVLKVELRPGGQRTPAGTGHRIAQATNQLQSSLTVDSF